MPGPVIGEDGVARCPWGAGDPVNMAYHDTEWGMPVHGESAYLERLTLEAFQSGLSWRTILNKREAFREVFHGFDADAIAAFGPDDVERLMAEPRIVRNRLKIEATAHQRAGDGRAARAGWAGGVRRVVPAGDASPRRRRPRRWWRPRRSRWRCRRR